ncbi:MAG: CBS domain-containing protein [Chloroflexi bacterium]|nr:CBS domain-containing protein [Chloroflexota bacterium]
MLIKDFMTRDPITVQSSATVDEVQNLLAVSDFHRLPVMEDDSLVGIVNWSRLIGGGPVKHCMIKNPVTAPPDTPLEEAARIMIDHQVGALLVTENEELIGIITLRDLFKVGFLALGARSHGVRVALDVPDMRGMLADVINELALLGAHFISLVNIPSPSGSGELVTIKVQDVTQQQVADALSALSIEIHDIRTV